MGGLKGKKKTNCPQYLCVWTGYRSTAVISSTTAFGGELLAVGAKPNAAGAEVRAVGA